MICCQSPVVLKRSHRGKQFFAHKAIGGCVSFPESEAHRFLKELAVNAARAHGWSAATEMIGTTPSGKQWKADVLAEKGKFKVAIEIQLSNQTDEELLWRQKRYSESGIRGLWLCRRAPDMSASQELPLARIEGDLERGFLAALRDQILPVPEFFDAIFTGHFQFGFRINKSAIVSVWGGSAQCWHQSCGVITCVITRIVITCGSQDCHFALAALGNYPDLMRTVLDNLPGDLPIGTIKSRFSKTVGTSYLSNG
jgi:competence protein CoiA